jgi:hypothetical protein
MMQDSKKIALPNKFQMRVKKYPGFTHEVKINGWGDYEVKWARGFPFAFGELPRVVFDSHEVHVCLEFGDWIIVEDKPKQKEEDFASSLPDEFYFEYLGWTYFVKRNTDKWDAFTCNAAGLVERKVSDGPYSAKTFEGQFKKGTWKLLDKKPLTPEQERQLKDFNEQIAALDQSIKLNQQDIAHKERLIGNYQQRKEDLQEKIAELKGEESPKLVKAKQMKAEMGKLKGSV